MRDGQGRTELTGGFGRRHDEYERLGSAETATDLEAPMLGGEEAFEWSARSNLDVFFARVYRCSKAGCRLSYTVCCYAVCMAYAHGIYHYILRVEHGCKLESPRHPMHSMLTWWDHLFPPTCSCALLPLGTGRAGAWQPS